jgi:hypothetical protein
VAHNNERSVALFSDMNTNTVRLYHVMCDSAHALPVNAIEVEGGFGCWVSAPSPAMNSRRRIECSSRLVRKSFDRVARK